MHVIPGLVEWGWEGRGCEGGAANRDRGLGGEGLPTGTGGLGGEGLPTGTGGLLFCMELHECTRACKL